MPTDAKLVSQKQKHENRYIAAKFKIPIAMVREAGIAANHAGATKATRSRVKIYRALVVALESETIRQLEMRAYSDRWGLIIEKLNKEIKKLEWSSPCQP